MEVLDQFRVEYQEYHGLSAGRQVEQRRVLLAFADHAGRAIDSCDADDLRAFLSDQIASGLNPNTVRKKNKMIRPFFQWAFDKGIVSGDLLMGIRSVSNPKGSTDRGLPKPYTAKELRQFRDELDARWPLVEDKYWDRFRQGRSRYRRVASEVMRFQIEAIVALALHCGLRRAEIYNLTFDDMHPDNAYVVVRHGKGDKPREVPFTEVARSQVAAWLRVRDRLDPPHDKPWIVAVANVPEGRWLDEMSFGRFSQLLTSVGEWRLHRFRHTSATTWLRAGMSLELVSRHLGHSNITQTLGYAELVRDDIQRAVEQNEGRFERLIGEDDGREQAVPG